MEKLEKMKLHDISYMREENIKVIRVVGGWIYEFIDSVTSETRAAVFVPESTLLGVKNAGSNSPGTLPDEAT